MTSRRGKRPARVSPYLPWTERETYLYNKGVGNAPGILCDGKAPHEIVEVYWPLLLRPGLANYLPN